ncbi:MAG: hypothetical protein JSS86_16325 [Cyanobacteria bacterium SZAS LIN-2]|nr:hypothetical protein [Cyanobacteria bacterium SZAS LIN-3]MBS1997891.1 hypothetical protein [Cyanobacteria bacterium SZAS LIN-2]MBS2009476.1 hypothetical protein [Cyanobacteria bacterium SZAS TMP-1]
MPNISNPARDIPNLFKADLQKGEKVLWSGQPVPRWFTPADIIMVPFSLLWGGFAFFWEGGVLTMYLSNRNPALLFMVFWGIPFVLMGSYLIFGRFLIERWRQKNTFYAVTNQRLLILHTSGRRSLQTFFLDNLPCLEKTSTGEKTGTISFSDSAGGGIITGMNYASNMRRAGLEPPGFCNIKDVDKVYALIAQERGRLQQQKNADRE